MFFRAGGGAAHLDVMHEVSAGTACILLVTYACGLWFTFRTHQHLLSATRTGSQPVYDPEEQPWTKSRAILVLLGSSVLMAIVAESLVKTVEAVGHDWKLNETFLGVVVLAMIGNAAENSSAIRFAHRNRMDLALNIVTQASVQIALFVTPVLILLSAPLGHPLDMTFTTFELLSVGLAVATVSYVVLNGETNWFEGVQLLALYMMIAVAIYFLP
jgi:Ca2+:H+ antiporter